MCSTQLNRKKTCLLNLCYTIVYTKYTTILYGTEHLFPIGCHYIHWQVAWADIYVLDNFNISKLLWSYASKKVSELPPISKPHFLTQHQCTCPHFQFYTIKATMPISGCPWAFPTLKQIEKSHRTSRSCSSSTISSMSTVTSSSVRARLSPCQLTSVRLSRLPRSNWAQGAKRF